MKFLKANGLKDSDRVVRLGSLRVVLLKRN